MALEIRFVVERINLLIEQIAELEKRWQTLMMEQRKLLQSIPGLGKVWAPTILAEILPVFRPEEKAWGTEAGRVRRRRREAERKR